MNGCRSALIALVLALCLLMPMGALGLVLCMGADGHMAFEPARNSRCTAPIAPTLSLQLTPWPAQLDHCGPCVDVPLLTSEADAQPFVSTCPLLLQLAVPELTLGPWVVSAASALPVMPFWLSPPRGTTTTLRALRTVMLLL